MGRNGVMVDTDLFECNNTQKPIGLLRPTNQEVTTHYRQLEDSEESRARSGLKVSFVTSFQRKGGSGLQDSSEKRSNKTMGWLYYERTPRHNSSTLCRGMHMGSSIPCVLTD